MRKANKILMATVAILLCLVLISTSVVSGVFAKFAINKTAMVEKAKLKQFGLTVGISGTNLNNFATATSRGGSYSSVNEYTEGGDKKVVVVSLAKNFKIGEGDECKNAAQFTISGTPITAAKLNIKIDLLYTAADFKITKNDFHNLGADEKYYMPLGFSFGGASSCGYVAGPWISGDVVDISSDSALENYIATQMAEKIVIGDTNTKNKIVSGNVISLEFTEDKAPNFTVEGTTTKNVFYMGFGWPDSSQYPEYAEISTFLAEQMSSMQIIYTVWVEQTAARAN